jgi:FkbM family methyltransferase
MFQQTKNLIAFVSDHPLTRDRKFSALLRVARWQLLSRLTTQHVIPWIEGTQLLVRSGMHGATGNIYVGLHEFRDMAFVLHFLRPDDLFVDVGANIGSYTVLASGVCKARTIAFEPDPETFEHLGRNIAINGLESLVQLRCAALGDIDGTATLTSGLGTMNMITEDDIGGQSVRISKLDTALAGQSPDFMKLDVEGHEPKVLAGAERSIACSSLNGILSESRAEPVLNLLHSQGFLEYQYDPFERTLTPVSSQDGNTLFIRDVQLVRARLSQSAAFRVLHHSI